MRYGIIGNCKSAALVHENSSIDWLCLPNFDNPSIFAKILDEEGGHFRIVPKTEGRIRQSYLPETNVLRTEFDDGQNAFSVVDYMPRHRVADRYWHPPEVHRVLEPIRGRPEFRVQFFPRLNYAEGVSNLDIQGNMACVRHGQEDVFLYASLPLDQVLGNGFYSLERPEFFLLSYHEQLATPDIVRVLEERAKTEAYWRTWSSRCRLPAVAPQAVLRSALVLKLMTFQETGAIIAAPTTSLPETVGEGRNWDYRYCWLRDASLMLEALASVGHHEEAETFLSFLLDILESKQSRVQILYRIDGGTHLEERVLPHLRGFRNSPPVRVGNAAATQRQNDVFGEVLEALYQYSEARGVEHLAAGHWSLVKFLVRTIAAQWREEDSGIWEYRNRKAHFTFSKVLSWVALDRGTRIARSLGKDMLVAEWEGLARQIREEILAKAWNPALQSFTQSYESDVLDVALLRMQGMGFLESTDPKWISTVRRCAADLLRDGFGFRYTATDDFGRPKNSFVLASFWIAKALVSIGEISRAEEIFEKVLAHANHLGLLSEHIDPETGELVGNFPQAFSHMALINTANLLAKSRESPLSP
ncbi:glycoside hydrolase family 15 protein [bacterium]|nr:MAG: glycoside hydrolase family 15 protein [bacterium]